MKYLFIELKIQDGEREHTHRVLHTTNAKNIQFAAQRYAAQYWGKSELSFKAWFTHGGEIAIEVSDVKELTKFEYDLMYKFFYDKNDMNNNNYFNIVHAGYRQESEREEIQIYDGENGNIFLYPTNEGLDVDVYSQNYEINSMTIWEDDLSGETEDDIDVLYPTKKDFSNLEIKNFKEHWGQSHDEICAALDLDQEGAEGFLVGDYFWVYEDQKWYPTFSSLYSEREQEIADYLQSF